MTEHDSTTMAGRLEVVKERIAAACARAGRSVSEVRLLAASKTQDPERVREAAACGVVYFGENRVQEARAKIPLAPSGIEWHMIGHLQTNKAREAVRLFAMIHSVDTLKLLRSLDAAGEAFGRIVPVLLEVNVSGEGTKFGLAPSDVPALLRASESLKRVEIRGLMTVPPISPEPEGARPFFRKLKELRDQWRAETDFALPELSMGMSHDFEVAIEEGATWVRLGTILFGKREARAQ